VDQAFKRSQAKKVREEKKREGRGKACFVFFIVESVVGHGGKGGSCDPGSAAGPLVLRPHTAAVFKVHPGGLADPLQSCVSTMGKHYRCQ